MVNKKVAVGFEMILIIVSIFSFMYFVGFSEEVFVLVSAEEDEEEKGGFRGFLDRLAGGGLVESESWTRYPISSDASEVGCCFASEDIEIFGKGRSKYSLEYLMKFIKGMKISSNVVVNFSDDYPLRLDFPGERMGIGFVLAPRV